MNERILILGAGVGGLVTANELRRLLPSGHSITVIEKNARHSFAPSFLWVMTGDRTEQKITRPVTALLQSGIQLVIGEVSEIDVRKHEVRTTDSVYAYDVLVIALGAELSPESIPGYHESIHTFFTVDGAARLRSALDSFHGGNVAVVVSKLPYKCPGAPHEGAMLLADFLRKRGLNERSHVHLYTPETQPMPVAGPELGAAVREMLTSNGIAFHPLHQLTAIDAESKTLSFEGGSAVSYDLCVVIPPHRSPKAVRESGLANDAGWIPVDRASLQTNHENVYAIGDVAAIALPGRWKPDVPLMLPKAGVFAHLQAEVVAHDIVRKINGGTATRSFPGVGYCMLEAGEDLAGFAYGDFYALPAPKLRVHQTGKVWHWGKVLFEKWWLSPFGLKRSLLGKAITVGAKFWDVPIKA